MAIHRLNAIQKIVGRGRYRAACSCGWRSNPASNQSEARTQWNRHPLPKGDEREANPSPKYPEVNG